MFDLLQLSLPDYDLTVSAVRKQAGSNKKFFLKRNRFNILHS